MRRRQARYDLSYYEKANAVRYVLEVKLEGLEQVHRKS